MVDGASAGAGVYIFIFLRVLRPERRVSQKQRLIIGSAGPRAALSLTRGSGWSGHVGICIV